MGFALEKNGNKSFDQLLSEEILIPLQMKRTFFTLPPLLGHELAQGYGKNNQLLPPMPPVAMKGGGALKSTVQDLMKFLQANLGQGPQDIVNALKLTQQGLFKVKPQFTQALGWGIQKSKGIDIFEKNGKLPGFSTSMTFIPDKVGVIALANKDDLPITLFTRDLILELVAQP